MADIRRETGPRTAQEIEGLRESNENTAAVALENRRKRARPSWGSDEVESQIIQFQQDNEVSNVRLRAPSNGKPIVLTWSVSVFFTGVDSAITLAILYINFYRDGELMFPEKIREFDVRASGTFNENLFLQFVDESPKVGARHEYTVTCRYDTTGAFDTQPPSFRDTTYIAQEV